ncbi:uncharacterized protein isoform X2 [Rhodnius prolixus]
MFASVRRCRSLETGEVFAAKFSSRMRYGEDCTKEIHHEIALLSLCSPSPRIIRLHDVFQTPHMFIIVMEFAPGGDMQTIIDDNLVPFESDVVKFIQNVVEGLAYLHHRKIAHLDIKPQNLVMMGDFPDCDIKVCDFEISRVILDGSEVHEILGTPEYVAPEILHYEPITLAADMWSLGVTTYVLLTGFSPFGGETDQETFLNISRAQVDFPDELFEDVSEEAKDFVKKLLVRNPGDRMTAKESLKHPWLAKARKLNRSNNNNASRRPSTNKHSSIGGRAGCASCPAPQQHASLRNYLSKSREALFERVVKAQGGGGAGGNIRKNTLVNQYNRTRRMCESQMSLVSKSRESLMSRSREKLYGVKSLSKSQEALSLYKSVLNLSLQNEQEKQRRTGEDSIGSSTLSIATEELCQEEQANKNIIERLTGEMEEFKEENLFQKLERLGQVTTDSQRKEESTSVTENRLQEILKKPDDILTERSVSPPGSPVASLTTSESDISEEEARICCDPDDEEDQEPRFTVAQLVSAYNKHQEVVTKSSLEVAMRSNPEEKIKERFPTGPNALRLFIPDIKIRKSKPKKRMPRKSTGLPPLELTEKVDELEEEINEEIKNEQDMQIENKQIHSLDMADKKIHSLEMADKLDDDDDDEGLLSDRLGVDAPPPKYLRSETSPEPNKSKKPPYYMTPLELKQQPMSNVAKTVELFNNGVNRPDRKSFSSPISPSISPASTPDSEKCRRKSSPPVFNKPFFP